MSSASSTSTIPGKICTNLSSLPPMPARSGQERSCVGIGLNMQQWKDYWNNNNCQNIFLNKIYQGSNISNETYSKQGFQEVVEDFDYMFSVYLSPLSTQNLRGGHTIGVPGQIGYDEFQNTLISACSDNPRYQLGGACQVAASKVCSKCTLDDITSNSSLLKLCGCEKSSLENIPQYSSVPPSCDPLCIGEQISKKRNPDTGIIEYCNSNVCVINNISIVSSESTIGGVSFNQICPSCTQGQNCICIIDQSVPTIGKEIGLDNPSTLNQYCGDTAICLNIDNITQQSKVVPCQTDPQLVPETYWLSVPMWVWFTVIFLVIIFILVLFSSMYITRNIPEEKVLNKSSYLKNTNVISQGKQNQHLKK